MGHVPSVAIMLMSSRGRYETVAGQIGHTTIDSLAGSYINQVLIIADEFDKEATRRPIDFDSIRNSFRKLSDVISTSLEQILRAYTDEFN